MSKRKGYDEVLRNFVVQPSSTVARTLAASEGSESATRP
jgi:hypothetical protein